MKLDCVLFDTLKVDSNLFRTSDLPLPFGHLFLVSILSPKKSQPLVGCDRKADAEKISPPKNAEDATPARPLSFSAAIAAANLPLVLEAGLAGRG